jgi:predicted O-linked N-acetylglucosamine transferase (SPINDLY family)
VAEDDEGYIAIARQHISTAADLEALRADLPARVAASAAGNGAIYTRRVEEGYRQFWRDYCAGIARPASGMPG